MLDAGGVWMRKIFSRFLLDQSGATSIEYALIASGIAIAIATAVQSVGPALNARYAAIGAAVAAQK
jgi:pilus assembly protein Flp/PilA